MQITPIPCLSDNYAYLVVCDVTGQAAIVDPSEAEPVRAVVEARGLKPRDIWCTHHHHDHVGGNEVLAAHYGTAVLGHVSDRGRIPRQTKELATGDAFVLGELDVRILHIPGHTLGAIAYVVREFASGEQAVFTGDTMFLGGCGRLFEGTPAQMHASFEALVALDPKTRVYCGHEYTESNLKFAKYVEPSNTTIDAAVARAASLRAKSAPTVPGTLEVERATNPFVRVDSAEIRATLRIPMSADGATALGAIRKAKDDFR
jgi:hydroxyacylglutathione hydrolase